NFKFESLAQELPAPDQLLLPDAVYDWTRELLRKIDEASSAVLIQAAEKSVAFDDAGNNAWFRAGELAATRALLQELQKETAQARDGARAFVQKCRSAAEALAAPWDNLLGTLPQPFRKLVEEHDKKLRQARQDFPIDPPYLLELDLGKFLNGPDAEERLDEAEQKLRALKSSGNLTQESQHSLLVNLVTARALARS